VGNPVLAGEGPLGRLAYGRRRQQRCAVVEPLAFEAQARQRGAGQVVEGAPAIAAAIALQVIGATMAVTSGAIAARTAACVSPDFVDERNHLLEPGCGMQRVLNPHALWPIQ